MKNVVVTVARRTSDSINDEDANDGISLCNVERICFQVEDDVELKDIILFQQNDNKMSHTIKGEPVDLSHPLYHLAGSYIDYAESIQEHCEDVNLGLCIVEGEVDEYDLEVPFYISGSVVDDVVSNRNYIVDADNAYDLICDLEK